MKRRGKSQPELPGFESDFPDLEVHYWGGERVFPTPLEVASGRAKMANLGAMAKLVKGVLDREIDPTDPFAVKRAIAEARGGTQRPLF